MRELAVLTVAYLTTKKLANLAEATYKSLEDSYYRLVVVNDNSAKFDLDIYNDEIIENDENCLSKAWNIGLTRLFEKGFKYVYCPNLDIIANNKTVSALYYEMGRSKRGLLSSKIAHDYPTFLNSVYNPEVKFTPVNHGDGSFSSFLISRNLFKDVGLFDERYKPAYFEDNDYLERMHQKGYQPLVVSESVVYHYTQGSIKEGKRKDKEDYPIFMQKNLELFKSVYGKVPDHLPEDISFI